MWFLANFDMLRQNAPKMTFFSKFYLKVRSFWYIWQLWGIMRSPWKIQKTSYFFPALTDSDTLKLSSIEPSQYLDGWPLDSDNKIYLSQKPEAQIISNGFFCVFYSLGCDIRSYFAQVCQYQYLIIYFWIENTFSPQKR